MPSTTVRALAKILAASVLVAVLATGVSAAVGEAGTSVRLSPRTGLLDEPVQLEVRAVGPRSPVALRLRTRDGNGLLWEARARARSDGGGAVRRDVSSLLPSLRPARRDLLPNTTLIGLPRGFDLRLDLIVEGHVVAGATARRMLGDGRPAIRELTLPGEGLVGRYRALAGDRPRPGVLLLGGSGGGLSDPATAALLASRGYPVLQLAYFGLPGLPAELKRIPLEYLERALRWLAARPEVDPERVIVVGSSRGAELGLLLGARFTSLVHGVAAYAPSSVVNPGFPSGLTDCPPAWTYEGTPIPHVTCDEYLEPRPTRPPESVIPVERIRGPILLVAGGDDTLWPSAGYTAAIVDRLRANDRSDFGTVVYRRAGHGAGATIPYLPLPTTYCTPSGSCSNLGGDTTADARARTTAWFRLREILARLRR